MSPALAGGFLTTRPPGKSLQEFFLWGYNRVSGFGGLNIMQEISPSSILLFFSNKNHFPGGSASKASACNAGDPGQSLGWEDPLKKGKSTHSSILAWKIPWTAEPGGYSPWGHKE